MTVRGVITRVDWVNPHSWIYVDAKGPDGEMAHWRFELGPPNALFRRGWTKNSVATGIEIVVNGYRAKKGGTIANARDVTLPDGRELFAGSSGTGAPYDKPDK